MEVFEFEGKTTEEAIEKASRELNLPVEELDIEVIEPGSAGIFGLVGSKKAKIKVTFKRAIQTFEENGMILAKEALERILTLIPVEATVNAEQSDHNIPFLGQDLEWRSGWLGGDANILHGEWLSHQCLDHCPGYVCFGITQSICPLGMC